MFTIEEMQEIVNKAKTEAIATMTTQIVDAIDYSVKHAIGTVIQAEITKTVEKDIETIAKEEWDKACPQVREIIAQAFLTVAESLGKAMTEQAVKNLDSYNRKDIIKKLFDIY